MRRIARAGSLSLLVFVVIAGCGRGAGNHDYSRAIAHGIQINGAQQIQRATNSLGGSGTWTIDDASCVQAASTQTYSCIVHYTYQNSEGTYKYEVNVSASCDSGGHCRWHPADGLTLVSADPD